jgi:DNA-directed RNA polymerase specialized sigma24 family protein
MATIGPAQPARIVAMATIGPAQPSPSGAEGFSRCEEGFFGWAETAFHVKTAPFPREETVSRRKEPVFTTRTALPWRKTPSSREAAPFFREAALFFRSKTRVFREAAASFHRGELSSHELTASSDVAPCGPFLMAPPLRDHPNARRLASPAVRQKVLDAIGKQLQPADAKDVTQEVYVRLFRLIDRLPETEDGLLGLVVVVTRGEILRCFRKSAVRDARHADESEGDAVEEKSASEKLQQHEEHRQLYAFALAASANGEADADCLRWSARLARGDEYADIAADESIPEATIRKRMERFRKYMRAHWKEYSGLGGVVLGALLLYFTHEDSDRVGAGRPGPDEPSPTTSAHAPETPAQAAARLRREAKAACDAHDWTTCESRLDEANRVDPTSNARPEVIELRTAIAHARSGTQQPPPAPSR